MNCVLLYASANALVKSDNRKAVAGVGNQNNERRYHFLSLQAMIRLSDCMRMTGEVVITPMKQITLLARAPRYAAEKSMSSRCQSGAGPWFR